MEQRTKQATELVRILAHHCRTAPNWLESEYRVPTRVSYGILTVAFAPPPPERDYIPEHAFCWRDEDGRYNFSEWCLMRDDARERYVVLEIGLDIDTQLYHRYYALPPHLIIASALQVLGSNDDDA